MNFVSTTNFLLIMILPLPDFLYFLYFPVDIHDQKLFSMKPGSYFLLVMLFVSIFSLSLGKCTLARHPDAMFCPVCPTVDSLTVYQDDCERAADSILNKMKGMNPAERIKNLLEHGKEHSLSNP